MEQYFYVICLLSFLVVFGLSIFLLRYINREMTLYKLFTKNNELRTLMAKDPMRFHISIIYLMTYMTRSDGDEVQHDKLELIVQYIREICPAEYQNDAINALQYLTDREKGSGKYRKTESIVDAYAFEKGGARFLKRGDDSFHYIHDLHGTKLAEELGHYLSEDDRLYVMYLLYRLAIADNKITTKGKKSESSMLHKLCVKGLKIEKSELQNLLNSFVDGTDQQWYDSHFANKSNRYPASDMLANIFRKDTESLSFMERSIPQTSVLDKVKSLFCVIGIIQFVVLILFINYEDDLMGDVYPVWFILVGIGATILVPLISAYGITKLESSILPVLRTKIENSLQLKGLLLSSILSIVAMIVLHFGVANLLFLIGNEVFSGEERINVTVPVTDTYTTTSRSKNTTKTHYHVRFREVSFLNADLDTNAQKRVSYPNEVSLKALMLWSGMKLKGVKNTKTIGSLEVNYSTYLNANGRDVRLIFKTGYFGLLYFDSYSLQ